MKYSIFSVMTPEYTPTEILPVLKKQGYHGIEWRCKETEEHVKQDPPSFWGNNLCTLSPDIEDDELQQLAQYVREHHLETVGVNPYLGGAVLEGKAGVHKTERIMHIARLLGGRFIRVGIPGYDQEKDYVQLFELTKSYLAEVEKLSRKYGVKGVVETHHHTITPSVSSAYRLVESFDPVCIGVLYDPGNLVHEGYENPMLGLQLLGPYLAHVHVKNAGWYEDDSKWRADWSQLDKGIIDWRQVIQNLHQVGYEGWLGIEDFNTVQSTSEKLHTNITYMQQAVNTTT
jgi:sugar phosphate isomerase/epimerase